MQKDGDTTPQNPVTIPPKSPYPTPSQDVVVEPTIYKVLACDPWTLDVSIAETTSTVPDQTTPLTPSEVLPRLSNPTKFLPHFEPLRAEGFEIVSGQGGILVFRQVREAPTSSSPASSPLPSSSYSASPESNAAASASSSPSFSAHPVNPIDMMGRDPFPLPNAAAFASPTGFVNYEDSSFVEERPQPLPQPAPARSDINVRRVSLGPKAHVKILGKAKNKAKERKKEKNAAEKESKSLGRRVLVGAFWLVGLAYAIGTVATHSEKKKGGVDGNGRKVKGKE